MVFRRLLDRIAAGRDQIAAPAAPVPVEPAQPFVAIGDVHGRLDLLDGLLSRCDAARPDWPVILVGDYVDRGEDSAGVLRTLYRQTQDMQGRRVCLIGNHEDMLLRFLDNAERNGPLWLRNGGLQTLASFGVGGIGMAANAADLERARDALALKMGDGLIGWLRNLPLYWQSGNVVVVHAAADPALPLADQKRASLIWGHKDFFTGRRSDGLCIVHGHTIMPEPIHADGRIAIDTGAYATGRLTAAEITTDGVTFLST